MRENGTDRHRDKELREGVGEDREKELRERQRDIET